MFDPFPLPVTTELLVYCPATAFPPAWVYCHVSVGSSRLSASASPTLNAPASTGVGLKSSPGTPGVPLSSVTTTFLIGSVLPAAVTKYVQVTGLPTGTY